MIAELIGAYARGQAATIDANGSDRGRNRV
jgi:hypothetical protein